MRVEICMEFHSLADNDSEKLQELAISLTNRRSSVTVTVHAKQPNSLVCEFAMRTQPHYLAVEIIDHAIEFQSVRYGEYTIRFPRTPAAIASAKRKAERRTTMWRAT
jgi:hypothetical protein